MTLPLDQPDEPSKSRENSVQHGYTGAGIVLPDEMRRQVDRHRVAFTDLFGPQNQDDRDLVHQAALGIVRFQSLQVLLAQRAELRAQQAISQWSLLRALDAQERAKRLPYDPQNIVTILKTTLGGVQWLRSEWDLLRIALFTLGDWTPKQQDRAQQLVGLPRIHKDLDHHQVRSGNLEDRKKLVKQHIEELDRLLGDPELTRLDELERQQTIKNGGMHLDPIVHRIALYERRAFRMYENARNTLQERLELRESADEPTKPRGSMRTRINRRMANRRPGRSVPVAVASPAVVANLAPVTNSVGVEFCGPPVLPPFYREFTPAEYLAKITDPNNIAMFEPWEVPDSTDPGWKIMARWIEENDLGLDVETTLRGMMGMLVQTGRERSAIRAYLAETLPSTDQTPPPKPQPDPARKQNAREIARTLKAIRKQKDQELKDKKKADRQGRNRRR